ncbi:MAG: hypothetical protein AABZ47_04285 [Planctomycetota bacterium]
MDEALAPFIGPALWLGGIVGLSAVTVLVVRRFWRRGESVDPGSTGVFTLEELRRLRDCGDLTIAEFENLKQKMIEEIRGQKAKD